MISLFPIGGRFGKLSGMAKKDQDRPLVTALACLVAVCVLIAPSCDGLRADDDGSLRFGDQVPFDYAWLVDEAKRLSTVPYEPPAPILPALLTKLSYDQYHDIRLREEAQIWHDADSPFQLEILPAGFYYTQPVSINIVSDRFAREVLPTAGMFEFGPDLSPIMDQISIPFSGLRVRNQINKPDVWDEFLVFRGASYFRAVGKGQVYGLSARGISIDTAEPKGEEFPSFRRLWIVKPTAADSVLNLYALLDGPSLTGAYHFTVRPGTDTNVDVEMSIFARQELTYLGVAPLTSMFLFNSTNRSQFDDFRDAVHDSSGLQMSRGVGEWLWRPLTNPATLQISAFVDKSPQGFGLIQRPRLAADYQDLDAHYELRPNLWVEPIGDWGQGVVELIEIPSERETDDNIVVFWRPDMPVPAGGSLSAEYRLYWGTGPDLPEGMGRFTATRIGRSVDGQRVLFVLDTAGLALDDAALDANIMATAGETSSVIVQANPNTDSARVSFEFDPKGATLAELRLQFTRNGEPASETWLYRWTPR